MSHSTTQKRAMVALRNLGSLQETIQGYLDIREGIDPSWEGPGSSWSLALDQSSEQGITLRWTYWTGCSCHGEMEGDELFIPVDELMMSENQIRDLYEPAVTRKKREAAERKERDEAERRATTEAKERAELAKLQAKYG